LEEKRYIGDDCILVVFDEAHRATGKYAYSMVVKYLDELNTGFRILGLSATPGNDLTQI